MVNSPLIGIILAGGKSERMGRDKSILQYHKGKSQINYLYDLLNEFCHEVYISTKIKKDSPIPQIIDQGHFGDIGPMAGLLSVYSALNGPFLVIGIDYPLLTKPDIVNLIHARDNSKIATAYFKSEGFYEPMLSIYEENSRSVLFDHFENNQISLQKILKMNEAKKVLPLNEDRLISVDTPELYRVIFDKLNGK